MTSIHGIGMSREALKHTGSRERPETGRRGSRRRPVFRPWHSGILVVLVMAVLVSACRPTGQNPGAAVDPPASPDPAPNPTPGPARGPIMEPVVIATRQFEGSLPARQPGQVISPDGKYMLAEQRDSKKVAMVAVSLSSGSGSGDDVVFTSVDSSWADDNFTWYSPLGWTSPAECSYLVVGRRQGPSKDRRGVAIVAADIATGKTEESTFIDLPAGTLHSVSVIPDTRKAILHVSGALWEYDMTEKRVRTVKDDLPTYDGLFHPVISPTGEHAAYRIFGENGGVYVLAIATGEERRLLPDDDTMSFLPAWSPDGKWIAAYTVGERPNAKTLQPWERYEYFEGEDGPLSVSPSITVVSPQGDARKSVRVDGKLLSGVRWSEDSKTLAFLTGTDRSLDGGGSDPNYMYQPLSYEKAMAVDISMNEAPPYPVANLRSLPGLEGSGGVDYCAIVQASAESLYFSVFSGDGSTLWHGLTGKPATKIGDGHWQPAYGSKNPVYDSHAVAILAGDASSEVWLLGSTSQRRLAETNRGNSFLDIAGYTKNLLAVTSEDLASRTSTLTVYAMFREGQR